MTLFFFSLILLSWTHTVIMNDLPPAIAKTESKIPGFTQFGRDRADWELGHSGHFRVQSEEFTDRLNNLYFWFQPCTAPGCQNNPDRKFILWLQGGPGGPGTFGAVSEIGNFWVNKLDDDTYYWQKRCYSWCADNDCLFVDQPVMTGYSFQTYEDGTKVPDADIKYTMRSPEAMRQVYNVLLDFFGIWSEEKYIELPFYIATESYGGVYGPHLAKVIVDDGSKVKLKGLLVGDPLLDSDLQYPFSGPMIYGMGLIDLDQKAKIDKIMEDALAAAPNCTKQCGIYNTVYMDDQGIHGAEGLYTKWTGGKMSENGLLGDGPPELSYYNEMMDAYPFMREYMHVDEVPPRPDLIPKIYGAMVDSGDACQSTTELFADLAVNKNLDVMIFSSTVDLLLGPMTTEAGVLGDGGIAYHGGFLDDLQNADRVVWSVNPTDSFPAGYSKCVSNVPGKIHSTFCYVVVRNAGHMTPSFQPRLSYDMFQRFTVGGGDFEKNGTLGSALECEGVIPFSGPLVIPACNTYQRSTDPACRTFTPYNTPKKPAAPTANAPNDANDIADDVIAQLEYLINTNETFRGYIKTSMKNAQTPPTGECTVLPFSNPPYHWCWNSLHENTDDYVQLFKDWIRFTPTPSEDGFGYYTIFYDLCYGNLEKDTCLKIVEENPGLEWSINFTVARGKMMDREFLPTSTVMQEWKAFLGNRWFDYELPDPSAPDGGFKTFNQFFTRDLRKTPPNPRPISHPELDDVMVAPGDTLINTINSDLTPTSTINTKFYEELNVDELLHYSNYSKFFHGGRAASCVLLPTVYHHYHSPVKGHVVESRNIGGTSFEMNGEFYNFLNGGNIGGYNSDFGVFGVYHRGYLVIETEKYGYVGYVAVGLDDVNSVIFEDKFSEVPTHSWVPIDKGERVGKFQYGGSLVILLFQEGVFSGLKVEMGEGIGVLAPPVHRGTQAHAREQNIAIDVDVQDENPTHIRFSQKNPTFEGLYYSGRVAECAKDPVVIGYAASAMVLCGVSGLVLGAVIMTAFIRMKGGKKKQAEDKEKKEK